MSVCIVGAGVSGIITCLELIKNGKPASEITIIDPYFDGGALGRHWGGIYSNTVWRQILESLGDYPTAEKAVQELSTKYESESRVLLHDISWLLLESLRSYFSDLTIIIDRCSKLQQRENTWEVHVANSTLLFKTVIVCQGGRQKIIDVGKPCIPLEIALDPARLSRLVRPKQTVAVFGLAHSGTLICKHLLDLGIKVYGIHKGETPFIFERDGHYDGIKQESAEIADRLLNEKPTGIEFIRYGNMAKVIKVLGKVDWVVSAVGFEASPIQILNKEGAEIPSEVYLPETAEIAVSLYGFGLAYPGISIVNEQTFKDVSIPSFLTQIRRCLPSILSKS